MQILLLRKERKIFCEEIKKMKKKTQNIMKGLGVAMAVGSVIAGASATMGSNSKKAKKTMQKAVNSVSNFVDTVSGMM